MIFIVMKRKTIVKDSELLTIAIKTCNLRLLYFLTLYILYQNHALIKNISKEKAKVRRANLTSHLNGKISYAVY